MSTSQQSRDQTPPVNPSPIFPTPDLSWRTEPEIDMERQIYLAERRSMTANSDEGLYPFQDVKLSRADVEWLLATHEDRNGAPDRDRSKKDRQIRRGLDLRGADLRQVDLSHLPLTGLLGGRSWVIRPSSSEEQHDKARVHLEGADLGTARLEGAFLGGAHLTECFLGGAHLEGAYLEGIHLEGADLEGAHLEDADLGRAHLEGANLTKAHLERANLNEAHLEGAILNNAHLEGANLGGAFLGGKPMPVEYLKRVRHWDKDTLPPTSLQGAFFDATTILKDAVLGEEQFGFVSLSDVHWGEVNLSVVNWEVVTMLGDERKARQTGWLYNYQGAVRAYLQLSMILREQGLDAEAARFAYRAQLLQRRVIWRQMLPLRRQGRKGLRKLGRKMVDYLFSWLFDLFAGYGYKPWRIFITYLLAIGIYTSIYYTLGAVSGPHLSWWEALAVSMTAFHGRVFFPDLIEVSDAQAIVAATESFVGLLIEAGLIITCIQRFFRK